MTIEERAKAYDEALERAKEIKSKILYSHLSTESCKAVSEYIDTIIPQLAESEDERIRKGLIKLLTVASEAYLVESTGIKKDSYLAWLEKQKEQKPVSFSCGHENDKPAEWKPQPESLEALMYAIEGEWDKIKPTSYLSRRLEDLYEGLVNTFNIDESLLAELPKTAYTAKDIEELRVLKDKIEASMESPVDKPAEWSEKDNIGWDEAFACVTRAEKAAKNEEELQNADTEKKWLKEIKFKYYVRPVKQEWSEEDENALKYLHELISFGYTEKFMDAQTAHDMREWVNRSLRPQPHWKPSEEQMMGEWLKDRDGCFWDGVEEGKKAMEKQMLKEAVEGEVVKDINNKLVVTAKNVNLDKFKFGDKVRIIIVKEENK